MINRTKTGPVLYGSLSAAAVLLLLSGFVINHYWHHSHLVSEPLHSSVEMLGGLLAILMALILLERRARNSDNKSALMAMGFLSMGILQGIHACLPPGQTFVFLYSMSALGGGFWFAMILVSDFAAVRFIAESRLTPWLVAVLSVITAIIAGLYNETLPAMVYNGQFTKVAIVINVIAGLLFAAAAVRLLVDFHKSGSIDVLLFAFMAVLFSMAELTFHQSALWCAVWWYWHAIRLLAFFIVFVFLYMEYKVLTINLRHSLEDWENTFNTISDMITIHDKDLNILHANTAAKQLLGLPDLINGGPVKCYKYFHGTGTPPEDCPSCSCLKTGEPVVFEKFEPYVNRHLEIRGMPQLDSKGRLIRLVHVTRDITDHKELQKQLVQSQKMEVVGQLAGGVAHDFNNILSAIISYGYLLNSDLAEDDPAREHVGKIMSLSDRAAKITRGLLAFGRKQPVEFALVGLNDITQNVLKLLSKFIREDIAVITEFTDKAPVVLADRTQIEQIIINLATNARDAMPDGGQIIVGTEVMQLDMEFVKSNGFGVPGEYALLSVRDTGTGMDKETRQKIFEPFFTTKEVGKGTGLGLSIVYGIMKQHNGYITASGSPGEGTLFRMYFPIIKAKPGESQEENISESAGKGETILLAEDEAELRHSLNKILVTSGYHVIIAVDGEDAVEKFMGNRDRIGLVVSDVVMPRKNGREAISEIRGIAPDIKVILTSGYSQDVLEKKQIINDSVILLSKPIMPHQFLAKIREVLEYEHKDEKHHTGS